MNIVLSPVGTAATMPAVPSSPGGGSDWDASDEEDEEIRTMAVSARGGGAAAGPIWQPDVEFAPVAVCTLPLAIGGTSFDQRLVALKCRQCNQAVLRFRSARWDSSVDYFYFRNYGGMSLDLGMLSRKLLPDPGLAAYACQCSWQSVADQKVVSEWGTEPGAEGGAGCEPGGKLRWLSAA
jgi:hypothetical protein